MTFEEVGGGRWYGVEALASGKKWMRKYCDRRVQLDGNWQGLSLACLLFVLVLAGCGPSEKQKAEQQRADCLDKICEGDTVPKFDPSKEFVFKLNGEWFIGPKEYGGYGSRLGFEWWDHKLLSSSMKRPPEAQALAVTGKGYDFSVEIFLQRHDGVPHGTNRYARLKQAETEGRLVSKTLLRPGLEMWRTQENDGGGPGLWYVATKYIDTDPNGSVLSCRDIDPAYARCVTAFMWRPNIGADIRFRAKHAIDWPEIYQETQRVLNLLKKA